MHMTKFESLEPQAESREELLPAAFINRLKTTLREKLDPAEDPEQADQMNALIEMRLKHLTTTYPDFKSYQTYYLLMKQPVPATVSKVDFPGDDSVVAFIEGL